MAGKSLHRRVQQLERASIPPQAVCAALRAGHAPGRLGQLVERWKSLIAAIEYQDSMPGQPPSAGGNAPTSREEGISSAEPCATDGGA